MVSSEERSGFTFLRAVVASRAGEKQKVQASRAWLAARNGGKRSAREAGEKVMEARRRATKDDINNKSNNNNSQPSKINTNKTFTISTNNSKLGTCMCALA